MLSVKFKKLKPASFISHMDMQRAVNRVIRRAGMDFSYSKGFNPHAFLKLSSPIPLGLESDCEFVTIEAEGASKDNVIEKMNAVSPAGLVFERAWETEKYPNFMAKIEATDYLIKVNLSESYKKKMFEEIGKGIVIKFSRDGEDFEKESYNLVYALISCDGGFIARLATGANTLRADRFIYAVNEKFGLSITLNDVKKIRTYFKKDGEFVPTEFVLDEMEG